MHFVMLVLMVSFLAGCPSPSMSTCGHETNCIELDMSLTSDLSVGTPDLSDATDLGLAGDLEITGPKGVCSVDRWCFTNPLPQGNTIWSAWALDANNVWAVGEAGTLIHWDGRDWSGQSRRVDRPLRGVWGVDANNVWAVGADGVILKWNGVAWTTQRSGTNTNLFGVWASDPNNAWAVGDSMLVLHWDGTSWKGAEPWFFGDAQVDLGHLGQQHLDCERRGRNLPLEW